MTRNSDLYLEDLLTCDHDPELAVADEGGSILYWLCRCGRRIHPPVTATAPGGITMPYWRTAATATDLAGVDPHER